MSKPYTKHTSTWYEFECDSEPWKLFDHGETLLVEHDEYSDWSSELRWNAGAWRCDSDGAECLRWNTRPGTPTAIEAFIEEHGVPDRTADQGGEE